MKTGLRSGAAVLLTVAGLLIAGSATKPQVPATKQSGAASSEQTAPPAKVPQGSSGRKIPCKVPENASLCYWTHGRLSVYEGNPSLRIWKTGTHRMLGVFNGPSHFPPRIASFDDDVFNPELPSNLNHAYIRDRHRWEREGNTGYGPPDIYADFEVCPLEREKKGEMQAVCVESARSLLVESRWR